MEAETDNTITVTMTEDGYISMSMKHPNEDGEEISEDEPAAKHLKLDVAEDVIAGEEATAQEVQLEEVQISQDVVQDVTQEQHEVSITDGVVYEEEVVQQGMNQPPHYQNLIIQHMDIAEPLSTLKSLLEMRLQCSLSDHQFYLQDTILLDTNKSLVDQCVQGDGMVQINLEVKSQPGVKPKINIVDILKPADEVEPQAVVPEPAPAPQTIQQKVASPTKVVIPLPEESENVTRWIVDQHFRREQERLKIPFDPLQWSEVHVCHWIEWAIKEFNLTGVNPEMFRITGKQLCELSHPEFIKLIPSDKGDVFWTHLELLRKCKFVAVMQQPTPHAITTITVSTSGGDGRVRAIKQHRPRSPRITGDDRMSPGNRTAVVAGTKRRRLVKNKLGKSNVWASFSLIQLPSGRICYDKAVCIFCKKEIKCNTTQSLQSLYYHVKKHHPKVGRAFTLIPEDIEARLSNSAKRTFVPAVGSDRKKNAMIQFKSLAVTDKIARYIIKNLHPYEVVNSAEFKEFVSILDRRYKIPDGKYFSDTVIPQMYTKVTAEVIDHHNLAKHVALTAEEWIRGTGSYMTIRSSLITDEWEIKNLVLKTTRLPENYTADSLSKDLQKMLNDWVVPVKPFPAVVSNSAGEINKSVQSLGCQLRFRCFAHTINISAKKSLNHGIISNMLAKMRNIISVLNVSTLADELLSKYVVMVSVPRKPLELDIQTRWNSTYDMMSTFSFMEKAIRATFRSTELVAKGIYTLTEGEVTLARDLSVCLKPLRTVTESLCRYKFSSISVVMPMVHKLLNVEMIPEERDSDCVKQVKRMIRTDLINAYLDEFDTLSVITVLDPRFKALTFLSEDSRQEIYTDLIVQLLCDSFPAPVRVKRAPVTETTATLQQSTTTQAPNITAESRRTVTETTATVQHSTTQAPNMTAESRRGEQHLLTKSKTKILEKQKNVPKVTIESHANNQQLSTKSQTRVAQKPKKIPKVATESQTDKQKLASKSQTKMAKKQKSVPKVTAESQTDKQKLSTKSQTRVSEKQMNVSKVTNEPETDSQQFTSKYHTRLATKRKNNCKMTTDTQAVKHSVTMKSPGELPETPTSLRQKTSRRKTNPANKREIGEQCTTEQGTHVGELSQDNFKKPCLNTVEKTKRINSQCQSASNKKKILDGSSRTLQNLKMKIQTDVQQITPEAAGDTKQISKKRRSKSQNGQQLATKKQTDKQHILSAIQNDRLLSQTLNRECIIQMNQTDGLHIILKNHTDMPHVDRPLLTSNNTDVSKRHHSTSKNQVDGQNMNNQTDRNINNFCSTKTAVLKKVRFVTPLQPRDLKTPRSTQEVFIDIVIAPEEPTDTKTTMELMEDEVNSYRACADISEDEDPLEWWRNHEHLFPNVAKLARQTLCIPSTSVPPDTVFSAAGDVFTAARSSLKAIHLDKLIFLKNNLDEIDEDY